MADKRSRVDELLGKSTKVFDTGSNIYVRRSQHGKQQVRQQGLDRCCELASEVYVVAVVVRAVSLQILVVLIKR